MLIVVDGLSKYIHFIPINHPYITRKIAEVFAKEIVRLHGIPQSILSDRDLLFITLFRRKLFCLQGIILKMSSSYHPKTDGHNEVVNCCLEVYLRCFASKQPKTWIQWVPWEELWYNSIFHVPIGTTPFETIYGRKPPLVVRYMQGKTKMTVMFEELPDMDEALRQLKHHLIRAWEEMEKCANKKRKDISLKL